MRVQRFPPLLISNRATMISKRIALKKRDGNDEN